jgi:parallel beta-helix repeat protein
MANSVGLKRVASVSLLFLLLIAIVSVMHWDILAEATPAMIDVPGKYPTIQDAINNAGSGDIIFVHKGTYYENIVINKSVSLIGEDRDLTVIFGSGALQPQYVINLIASGASVKDFTIRTNASLQSPIAISSAAGNVVENNIIEDGFNGLQLFSSYANVISDNIISDNQYRGLYLYASGYNVFSGNVFANNVVAGIELDYSDDNVFSGNTIHDNTNGIALYSSSNGNVFYHNNFNNTLQLWSDSTNSTNVWSVNGEGNYWSDYSGRDLNGDGIGSSPYSTDTEGGDSYPLMGPFYDLSVPLNGQTYDVNLISNSSVSGLRFAFGEETGNKMVIFNVAGEEGIVGFCRIMIPLGLMDSPFIIIGGEGEIVSKVLSASNKTDAFLYFTWSHSNQTISIISSETLHLYTSLLDEYDKLLAALNSMNATQSSFLENYSTLLANLSELQNRDSKLNASYYGHLSDYSRNVENLRNLMYVFAATTAIFLITTVYLSRRANPGIKQKPRVNENEE